jgi:hypothetical protein
MRSDFSLKLKEKVLYNATLNNNFNGRLSLFFNTNRNLNIINFFNYLEKSSNESIIDTFLLIFYIRDYRKGKGERQLGRYGFIWLFLKYPKYFSKIIKFIPEYGRWDDIMEIWPKKIDLDDINFICDNYCVNKKNINIDCLKKVQNDSIIFIGNQLIKDKQNMLEGKSVSLCAKWCPTENCSLDIRYSFTKILCKKMKWSLKKYRKEFISPLRSYLKITEKYMCNCEWEKIDFDNIPYYCVKKFKKSFESNIPEKFNIWKQNIKITKKLFPHQVLYCVRNDINNDKNLKYWEEIENEFSKLKKLNNTICVCDVSPSMYKWEDRNIISKFSPIDISISLSILISKYNNTIFNNHVISFSTNPEFTILNKKDKLLEKYNKIKNISWEGNIDIEGILHLILDKLKKYNIKSENIPENLLIISDMKFSNLLDQNLNINLDKISEKYTYNNYKIPKLIFWNLNYSENILPIYVHDNVTIISGFSLIILNIIIYKKKFNISDIMNHFIYNERYNSVLNQLNI